jgi:hypothetical protein
MGGSGPEASNRGSDLAVGMGYQLPPSPHASNWPILSTNVSLGLFLCLCCVQQRVVCNVSSDVLGAAFGGLSVTLDGATHQCLEIVLTWNRHSGHERRRAVIVVYNN